MFNVVVELSDGRRGTADPEADDRRRRAGADDRARPAEQILALQEVVRQVPVAEHVFVYARDLVRATRPKEERRSEVHPAVHLVGRRSAGRPVPDPRRQGPGAAGRPVPRHHRRHPRRRLPGPAAPPGDDVRRQTEGITTDSVVDMLLEKIPVRTGRTRQANRPRLECRQVTRQVAKTRPHAESQRSQREDEQIENKESGYCLVLSFPALRVSASLRENLRSRTFAASRLCERRHFRT